MIIFFYTLCDKKQSRNSKCIIGEEDGHRNKGLTHHSTKFLTLHTGCVKDAPLILFRLGERHQIRAGSPDIYIFSLFCPETNYTDVFVLVSISKSTTTPSLLFSIIIISTPFTLSHSSLESSTAMATAAEKLSALKSAVAGLNEIRSLILSIPILLSSFSSIFVSVFARSEPDSCFFLLFFPCSENEKNGFISLVGRYLR